MIAEWEAINCPYCGINAGVLINGQSAIKHTKDATTNSYIRTCTGCGLVHAIRLEDAPQVWYERAVQNIQAKLDNNMQVIEDNINKHIDEALTQQTRVWTQQNENNKQLEYNKALARVAQLMDKSTFDVRTFKSSDLQEPLRIIQNYNNGFHPLGNLYGLLLHNGNEGNIGSFTNKYFEELTAYQPQRTQDEKLFIAEEFVRFYKQQYSSHIKNFLQSISCDKKNELLKLVEQEDNKHKYGFYSTWLRRNVFISYCHKAIWIVDKIVQKLEDPNGLNSKCWHYIRNLPQWAGTDILKKCEEAIDSCDIFLLILDNEIIDSEGVNKEIKYAQAKNKPRIAYQIGSYNGNVEINEFINFFGLGKISLDASADPEHESALDELANRVGAELKVLTDNQKQKTEKHEREIVEIKKELNDIKKDRDNYKQSFNASENNYRQKIQNIYDNCDSIISELESKYNAKLNKLGIDNHSYQEKTTRLMSENTWLKNEIINYKKKAEGYIELNDSLTNAQRALSDKNVSLNNDIKILSENIGRLNAEIELIKVENSRTISGLDSKHKAAVDQLVLARERIEENKKKDTITRIKIGEKMSFGAYLGIEWRVLDIVGNEALLVSDNIISTMKYGNNELWKGSYIRSYLNGEFYNGFTKEEKESIIEVKGDKITLLTLGQVGNKKYFANNAARVARLGDKANSYWLKDAGSAVCAASVYDVGFVYSDGNFVDYDSGARPALWLNLKSAI